MDLGVGGDGNWSMRWSFLVFNPNDFLSSKFIFSSSVVFISKTPLVIALLVWVGQKYVWFGPV